MELKISLTCLLFGLAVTESFKILGIFPYNGRSHHILFSTLMEKLAEENHQVTVINYFPMKESVNLKQISLQDKNGPYTTDQIDLQMMYKDMPYYFRDFYFARRTAGAFASIAETNCQKMMEHPEVLQLLKSDKKFDLVIVEQFVTDCGLGLVQHFKSPAIGIAAHVLMPWTYARFGIPNDAFTVPNHFLGTGNDISLWGATKSFLINTYLEFYFHHFIQKKDHEIISRVLPDTPDLEVVAGNLSLLMINQHFVLTGSRLFPANVIEVGGMHIKQSNLQDKELLKFIEESKDGVVYISLGTVARTTSLPVSTVEELLSFMRSSRQRFLWKREDGNLTDPPSNLMIREWMPQVDILCHPNVVAFVSHSGMLSSAEALHCGVPLVSVPLFGDQFANAASARDSGVGVTLHHQDLDRRMLAEALEEVLQPEFVSGVKRASRLWLDRMPSPLEGAVFWSLYVARHGGAPHLRPRAAHHNLQRCLALAALALATAAAAVLAAATVVKVAARALGARNYGRMKKTM